MEDIYDAHVRNEHPVKQRIQSVTLAQGEGAFTVGAGNITLIEPTVKRRNAREQASGYRKSGCNNS